MLDEPINATDEEEDRPEPQPPAFQFTLRQMFFLTTVVAVICSAIACLKLGALFIFGAALGAFVGALVCPWLGLDYVLDDVRMDVLRCLAVGAFLVGGAWGMWAGFGWWARQVGPGNAPVVIPSGLGLCFLFADGAVVRFLWRDSESPQAVIIVFGSIAGTVATFFLALALR